MVWNEERKKEKKCEKTNKNEIKGKKHTGDDAETA